MTVDFQVPSYVWLVESTHFGEFLDLAFTNDPGEVWLFNNDLEMIRERRPFMELYLQRVAGSLRDNIAAVRILVRRDFASCLDELEGALKRDRMLYERLAELAELTGGRERLATFFFGIADTKTLPSDDTWVFYARRAELDSGIVMLRHQYFPFHAEGERLRFAVVWMLGHHGTLSDRLKGEFYERFKRDTGFLRMSVKGLKPFDFELVPEDRHARCSFRSGVSLSVGEQPDVTLIAALPEELAELEAALREEGMEIREIPLCRRYKYKYVVLATRTGPKRVLLTSVGQQGAVRAAVHTLDLIREWRPKHVILVGVAGADPKDDSLKQGDVVIGQEVLGYEYEKRVSGGTEKDPTRWGADPELFNIAASPQLQIWKPKCRGPNGWSATSFQIHYDLVIGSGNKLIADDAFFKEIQTRVDRRIKAVEMEADGVACACERADLKALVIKGIMDKSDAPTRNDPKRDEWKHFAARVAAEFAVAVIKQL
jgi:nucleoside phosphorylase